MSHAEATKPDSKEPHEWETLPPGVSKDDVVPESPSQRTWQQQLFINGAASRASRGAK